MTREPIRYWSHGPHYQFKDSIVFITWRVAGTLPAHIIALFNELSQKPQEEDILHDEVEAISRNEYLYNKFLEYDKGLVDFKLHDFSLNDPEIAQIISQAFHFFDGKRYELHAYCIMHNHIHLLIRAMKKNFSDYYRVADIIQSLKRFTARRINKHLGKQGNLWDRFYFDRVIRNSNNYLNVINYIKMNPVVAGVVKKPEDFRDTYVNLAFWEALRG